MKHIINYTPCALQFIATMWVLSVVCVSSSELPPGEVAGQYRWLAVASVPFVFLIGASLLLYPKIEEKYKPDYSRIVAWCLIILGSYEALAGLRQLYGFTTSNHSLFSLTGTFFNPGPYSGYLAMVMPVCLDEHYRLKRASSRTLWSKFWHYIPLVALLLIACVLPAGMSRSAWIAAGCSMLFVASFHYNWYNRIKDYRAAHKKRFLAYTLLCAVFLFVSCSLLFYLKKDSASGRLFMWKIELQAIAAHPFIGHGAGNFASAYGTAQENYFAAKEYAGWEEHVAGSPEYAFNEYLQAAIEYGVPAMLLVLVIIAACVRNGIKQKRIGICGAILSLLIFSFSSYPLQFPPFSISLCFMLFACVADHSRLRMLLFALIVTLSGVYLRLNKNDYNHCLAWMKTRMLYQVGAYESAEKSYAIEYARLKNRAAFMFEYGHCLHKLHKHQLSTQVLKEAMLLTSDPMVLNVIGKNYQALKEYAEAEHYYLRATNRLPGRIYPYYLLAKLYAEPQFLQPEKFYNMYKMVMEKEPKVQSTAIKEMREEIQALKDTVFN